MSEYGFGNPEVIEEEIPREALRVARPVRVDRHAGNGHGQDDTSGEVFPPYRARIHYCEDGRFRWTVWPSILEFHETNDGISVSVATPGGGLYRGTRSGTSTPDVG